MEHEWLLYGLLFIVALIYSSVGHGGASGYLALMALLNISSTISKPTALVLNAVVSLIAFIAFFQKNYFDKKLFMYLAIGSVPMAYIGAQTPISDSIYKVILAIMLLIASFRLFFSTEEKERIQQPNYYVLLLIGCVIGYLSGLIGIGGGIILSPLLILLGWSTVKNTSGISALFIFVNSMTGLLALFQKGIHFTNQMYYMLIVAVIGGIVGSMVGSRFLRFSILKKILGLGLIIAFLKLMLVK